MGLRRGSRDRYFQDEFDLDGVAEALCAKLIRRNPHVFEPHGALNPKEATVEEIDAAWDRIKAQEKAELD